MPPRVSAAAASGGRRMSSSSSSSSSRPVVRSLYRLMLRWLNQPVVKHTPFLGGDLPPELLGLGLRRQQLMNREGARDAIVSTFRSRAALADPADVSRALDVGFKGLQYLNGLTGVLERAQERRRNNLEDRKGVQYRVGDVVRHQLFSYRGVILGWDRRPTIDVSSWDGVVQTTRGPDQPFYHVAPDSHDVAHFLGGGVRRKLMYVAEDNLRVVPNQLERRVHSDVIESACSMYDTVTGRFVLEERIAYQYPADVGGQQQQPPQQHHHHRKNLRLSAEQAKMIDAARHVQRQVGLLAQRLHHDLQRQFGVLERFDDPVKSLIELLVRMVGTEGASSPGDHERPQQLKQQKRPPPDSKLQSVVGGYDSLRSLGALFALAEDLHASRLGSKQRDGVAFELGQVVRHSSLGYR
jgi:hemimethylated DNA binding protein